MVDGLVYRNFERPAGTSKYFQLLMPRSLRPAFLEMVHTRASGHFSWRKTQKQVQRRAYWASWKTDTKLYCACCRACNEFHRGRPPRQAGLKPIVAGAPIKVLNVDLTGPHVTSQGYRWEIRVEEEFPLLHLAVLLVLGTWRLVAQGLMEAALLRLQQDPSGSTVLRGFLEDLLQILR